MKNLIEIDVDFDVSETTRYAERFAFGLDADGGYDEISMFAVPGQYHAAKNATGRGGSTPGGLDDVS